MSPLSRLSGPSRLSRLGRRTRARGCLLAATVSAVAIVAASAPAGALPGAGTDAQTGAQAPATSFAAAEADLYLVTLTGPGTAGTDSSLVADVQAALLTQQQTAVLSTVGAPEPVYRWTSALNGVAVRLDPTQAAALAGTPGVALVEPSSVQPLASTRRGDATSATGTRAGGGSGGGSGGAGTVIGLVDTGIDPDSPLFAPVAGTAATSRFVGGCQVGADWDVTRCGTKLVGAAWFVDGFGADRVRAATSLSARDDDGHGTQMASLAAGNGGLPVRVGGVRLGDSAGRAPEARVAAYKACWSAPDPADDGCDTADVVSAVDRATADRVDVLNLSLASGAGLDTVERALLGATEAGIVVVAAAGNRPGGPAAHPSPWVITVGGSTGEVRRGAVRLPDGRTLGGAGAAARPVPATRAVLAEQVASAGTTPRQARTCGPGSLDAAAVADRVVLCERGGGVGRVVKSQTVRRADGIAMVLLNTGPGSVEADFHAVPTVHLAVREARTLRRWVQSHPRGRVALAAQPDRAGTGRVAGFSRSGDPRSGLVKPDLVAPATGLVGGVPAGLPGAPWDVVAGTSAAAAQVSGDAAVLLARRSWSPDLVRSALSTTAAPVTDARVLRAGAGRVDVERALAPGLAFEVSPQRYRDWLADASVRLNLPSVVLEAGERVATRRITHLGSRVRTFTVSTSGFARHDVRVSPPVVRLGPGRSTRVRITAAAQPGTDRARRDDGYLTWAGPGGTRARVPVLISP